MSAGGTQIDVHRIRRAVKNLSVEGLPTGHTRQCAIASAIGQIQSDGATALLTEYVGVKNYAGFGDQREDHSYGYGPRHGYIVFQIDRSSSARACRATLGLDEVYALECLRDFPGLTLKSCELPPRFAERERDTTTLNLFEVVELFVALDTVRERIVAALSTATVESHEEPGPVVKPEVLP